MLHVKRNLKNSIKSRFELLRNRRGFTLVEAGIATALTALGALALGTIMINMAQFKNQILIENCMQSVRANLLDNMSHDYNWYATLMDPTNTAFTYCRTLGAPPHWPVGCTGSAGPSTTPFNVYIPGPTGYQLFYNGLDTTAGYTNQCQVCNSTNFPWAPSPPGGVGKNPACIIQLTLSFVVLSPPNPPQLATGNDGAYAATSMNQSGQMMVTGTFSINAPATPSIQGIPTARYGFNLTRWTQ